jgi:hypothetical protein
MSRGLRNYVLEDESSFSEAMADARSEDERSATTHQLDAFHKTFNFCMTCRQYTCGNCWNTEDGRCLTCSPVAGSELEAPAAAAAAGPAITPTTVDESWPDADLSLDRLTRALRITTDDAADVAPDLTRDLPGAREIDAAPAIEAESPAIEAYPASLGSDAEPAPLEAVEPNVAPAAGEGGPPADEVAPAEVDGLRGLAPGQSLEDAVAAYEAKVAADEAIGRQAEPAPSVEELPTREPAAAVAAEAEPAPAVEELPTPEPAAAAPEAEPAAPVLAPEPPPAPEILPAPARDDIVAQPTWPVAASATPEPAAAPEPAGPLGPPAPPAPADPATPAVPANPWLTVAPDDGTAAPDPQWPIASGWGRNARTDVPTTLAGRQLIPRDDAAAMWAASAAEVLSGLGTSPQPTSAATPVAPQPCLNCGLSLSANARFCRRCGTRQG